MAKVIITPDGKTLIQSTFMDTTERKRALQQVEAERDRYDRLYKLLYNTAVCGIVQVDIRSNKILSINRIALDVLDEKMERISKSSCLMRIRRTNTRIVWQRSAPSCIPWASRGNRGRSVST